LLVIVFGSRSEEKKKERDETFAATEFRKLFYVNSSFISIYSKTRGKGARGVATFWYARVEGAIVCEELRVREKRKKGKGIGFVHRKGDR